MSSGASSLPRDPDILIEMIAGLRAENEKLRAMLETLKRALYGARSEKRDADEAQLERLSTLQLPPHAKSIGQTVGELAFAQQETHLVSLRRQSGQIMPMSDDLVLMAGDTLVISGKADALSQAELKLIKG